MKHTRAKLLSFTILTSLALAPAAFADAVSEALVKDFIAKLDASAKWDAKAGAITSEGHETVIANLLISETGGPAKLEAASIRVTDLAQSADGGISLSLATVTKLTAGAPQLSITAPQIRLEAFTSPGLQGWEFDSKQPITSMMRLYTRVAKTEFGLLSIPSLATSQVILEPGAATGLTSTSTMSGMRYENLKGGVLALITSGKVESATAGAGGPSGPMVMQWDGFSAKNVNFTSISRVFDPDTYAGGKGDGVWMDMLESASYGKMVIAIGGKQNVTLGGIDISGVQLRQPDQPIAPVIDQLGSSGGNLPPDQGFALFEQYGQSLMSWFRLNSLKLNSIKVVPPEGGEMEIAAISLDGLSPDGMKRLAVEGLRFSAPQGAGGGGLTYLHQRIWQHFSIRES